MRLREIFYTIDSTDFEKIILKRESGQQAVSFKNIAATHEFINRIKNLSPFKNEINTLEQTLFFTMNSNTKLPVDDAQVIISMVHSIITNAKIIHSLIKDLVPISVQESISIKMPPLADFNELVLIMKTLEQTISPIVLHKDIGGYTKVDTWEPGSLWLSIIVGTTAAINIIASIVWASTVIYKKIQECKIIEEHVKLVQLKKESIEDLVAGNKNLINMAIEIEAKKIQNDHFKTEENEDLERLKNAIRTFSDLIYKGTEIHPSLTAPESSKELFPSMTAIDTVMSKVKEIENKS